MTLTKTTAFVLFVALFVSIGSMREMRWVREYLPESATLWNTVHNTRITRTVEQTKSYVRTASSCYAPHPFFRPSDRKLPLPLPIINLGFPKAGTNTLGEFFRCGNRFNVSHQHCRSKRKKSKCAECMHGAIERGDPPLKTCGSYGAYLQLDATFPSFCYWPQIEALEEFHKESPNATFLLNTRNVINWYNSLTHWNKFHQRIGNCPNFTGYGGEGPGSSFENISTFFCNHVESVRQFVLTYPSHALVEVDIEDPHAGVLMSSIFGINETCWGHANVNSNARKGEKL